MNDPQGTEPTECWKCDFGGSTVLVPEGKTSADLKMSELDIASRKLGTDVLAALGDQGTDHEGNPRPPSPLRYKALMLLAWLWGVRHFGTDAKPSTYADMEIDELQHVMGYHRQRPEPAPTDDDADGLGPTSPDDEASEPG